MTRSPIRRKLASLKAGAGELSPCAVAAPGPLREQPDNATLHRDLALSNVHLGDLADSMGQSADQRLFGQRAAIWSRSGSRSRTIPSTAPC